MPKKNCQKIKMLKLVEILNRESDEAHPLPTNKLINRLAEYGITCDRRTLYKDMALLNELGYEVMSVVVNRENAYYVDDRSFSVPELKILIDAVQAAAFITESKTKELVKKIADLGGEYKSELLRNNIICFNTSKHTNEQIYYNVERLETAVREHKKASFFYFDLNENCEKVFRKNKQRYVVEPMALIFNEDNYYLMCYSSKYDNICNYRIDRMEQVEVTDEIVSDKAVISNDDVSVYTKQVFKMYGGTVQKLTLTFDKSLIGAVHDKFGEKIEMIKINDALFSVEVTVQNSPTFNGWINQFGDKIKVEIQK